MRYAAILLLFLLALVVAVALIHYKHQAEHLQQTGLLLTAEGRESSRFSLQQLKALNDVAFSARLKSSGRPATTCHYQGIPMLDILAARDIVPAAGQAIHVKARDGYTVALTAKDLQMPVYLAHTRDGKPLTDSVGQGGGLQLIIPSDPHSQRWCKDVREISIR